MPRSLSDDDAAASAKERETARAKEEAASEKTRKTRSDLGQPRKPRTPVVKVEPAECEAVLRQASVLMRKAGIKELSDDEIKDGGQACAPMASKYLPLVASYGVEIGFGLWALAVVLDRLPPLTKREKVAAASAPRLPTQRQAPLVAPKSPAPPSAPPASEGLRD